LLQGRLRQSADDREWSSKFHSLGSLILTLIGEVGELASELQWVEDHKMPDHLNNAIAKGRLASEAADVLTYVVQFAAAWPIDLASEAYAKIARNEIRYPSSSSEHRGGR
jgi:NTP pyrophosphatase (non-canonical NTP hydrolase)